MGGGGRGRLGTGVPGSSPLPPRPPSPEHPGKTAATGPRHRAPGAAAGSGPGERPSAWAKRARDRCPERLRPGSAGGGAGRMAGTPRGWFSGGDADPEGISPGLTRSFKGLGSLCEWRPAYYYYYFYYFGPRLFVRALLTSKACL